MGCNCCRMLNSYMFKPQEPQTNGYVNEAHSLEHDHSTSPTIKISELKNEGHGVTEQDRFSGSPDIYNVPEKNNAKPDNVDSREPVSFSSNAFLNINFTGDIKQVDHPSRSNTDLQTKSPSHQHDMDQHSNLKRNSDEPECIQHELCEPMEENNSLTESAILEAASSQLTLQTSNPSMSSVLNGPGKKNWLLDANTEPPDKNNLGSSSSLAEEATSGSSGEPSLVALMIKRTIARNSNKGLVGAHGVHLEDDMDPDVAEALAALAAAIAGEELEDSYSDFEW
ncbi:uncharacterized protein LOC134995305 isoform X2 [Pseudophryne corroboree]